MRGVAFAPPPRANCPPRPSCGGRSQRSSASKAPTRLRRSRLAPERRGIARGRADAHAADGCPVLPSRADRPSSERLAYDAVEIDLGDRPAWLYEKNPLGKVPVLEEDGGLVLPESLVIMEYLEERYPEPALWPADPAERARASVDRPVRRLWSRLLRCAAARRRGRGTGLRRTARGRSTGRSKPPLSVGARVRPGHRLLSGSRGRARIWVSSRARSRRSWRGSNDSPSAPRYRAERELVASLA